MMCWRIKCCRLEKNYEFCRSKGAMSVNQSQAELATQIEKDRGTKIIHECELGCQTVGM